MMADLKVDNYNTMVPFIHLTIILGEESVTTCLTLLLFNIFPHCHSFPHKVFFRKFHVLCNAFRFQYFTIASFQLRLFDL